MVELLGHAGVVFLVQRPHYVADHVFEDVPRYVTVEDLFEREMGPFAEHGSPPQHDELRAMTEWNATATERWHSTLEPGDGCCTPFMGLLCARRYYAGFEAADIRKARGGA